MALHERYTDGTANNRVYIKFSRQDLLWKTDAVLTSPDQKQHVPGLPIRREEYAIGPTILDMMVRRMIPVTNVMRKDLELPAKVLEMAFWHRRDLVSLWPSKKTKATSKDKSPTSTRILHHPFQPGLASGGRVESEDADFVLVEKLSTVSISEMAMKLAVGMTGSIGHAYTHIGTLAAKAWDADMQRARELWNHIQKGNLVIEDEQIAHLRPASSISQEIERLILRQACAWLGVDPDLDCSRSRGRPREASVEAGKVLRITVSADERLHGEMLIDFNGIEAGTKLDSLETIQLIKLLGALRIAQHEFDVDLLEAFLDAVAPDWRDQATASASNEATGPSGDNDPYEILGIAKTASLDEVTKAYRRAMQKIHPDVSNLAPWFARVVANAYKTIRQSRGDNDQT